MDETSDITRGVPARRFTFNVRGAVLAAVLIGSAAVFAPLIGAYLAIVVALIVVHEGAHLVAARRCGLVCSEYAVGFGPVVAAVHTANMTWAWRAIPAGGFVKIAGQSETSEVPDGVAESATLRGTTRMRRVVTIAAGPLSNLALAAVLSAFAFGVVGAPTGDGERVRSEPLAAVSAGVGDVTATMAATLSGLSAIVGDADGYAAAVSSGDRSEAPAAFLSPLGAADLIGELEDPFLLLRFAAIISAGLGVFNLLPFPPLDGGHLAVEAVNSLRSRLKRRRVVTSTRVLNYASVATLTVFALLTVTALRFDLAAG